MNNHSDQAAYWKGVVNKLYSKDVGERGWAAHVLAVDFPKEEKSNLARALEHCDPLKLKERVAFLAEHDEDSYTGSECLHILKIWNDGDA